MTALRILATPCVRVLPSTCSRLRSEGAGKAGRRMHPQPRVRGMEAHECSHHRFTADVPAFPARWFTAYSELSPVTGWFATVAYELSADLTPASGRQDHTASPSAPVSFVVRYRPRPSHPAPTCLDVHDTPLQEARDGRAYRGVSGRTRSTLFLQPGLDMLICPSGTALRCFARRATPTTVVIPGRATWREPGIHNHGIAFGARWGGSGVQIRQ